MRIAIGQLWQETNTLNTIPTTAQDFEDFGLLRGPALVEGMSNTNELGGFIQALHNWPEQPEIVGLVRLAAWPGGRATAGTFRWLRDEMLGTLTAQMPVDAILLALHGSLAADGTDDVEGEVLDAVRQVGGAAVPVVATLDLHANVTQRMVEAADALVLYHTIPHIDLFDTGQRAARLLRRILIDGARPVTAWQKLPLVVPAEAANSQDASSISYSLKHRLQQLEATPGVLAAGLATVQPWLDVPELGTAVVVVTDGAGELARHHCAALAAEVWQWRGEYLPTLVSIAEGVRLAHENAEGLVVLADSADATTSGAPGDSSWILQELLKYDWPRPALVAMVDPETVTL
ncbi:MAG TPA: M81 family metallopeptidase, partial [Gemmataceae bacterium]|nr:M81 family metallopeptidase [Gemmataceae bacterium]